MLVMLLTRGHHTCLAFPTCQALGDRRERQTIRSRSEGDQLRMVIRCGQ